MLRHDVEKIIVKYAPGVLPIFSDKFERWPREPGASEISDSLYKMEKTYRGLSCEKEASECFQAANEIQLRKNE